MNICGIGVNGKVSGFIPCQANERTPSITSKEVDRCEHNVRLIRGTLTVQI